MLENNYIQKELNKFGKFIVQQSRARLTQNKPYKKIDRRGLYKSLSYKMIVHKRSSAIELSISMEDYGKFVDKGVKGVKSSRKAPDSPYKFGTGTGKKGGLTNALGKWVRRKQIQFRDKKTGRFLTYNQTMHTIRRSIWLMGIRTTKFYSRPFELAFKKLPEDIIKAYGLDLEEVLKLALK